MGETVVKKAVRIEKEDNVAVAVQNIAAGDSVKCGEVSIVALDNIPEGHKISVSSISKGENIVKYAVTIGLASGDIRAGEYVHSHNVEDITDKLCNEYEKQFRSMEG